ncbi:MAG: hypothetical protein ACHQ2Y_00110 [Candidatus Lutacidiplasmatales archaeon]
MRTKQRNLGHRSQGVLEGVIFLGPGSTIGVLVLVGAVVVASSVPVSGSGLPAPLSVSRSHTIEVWNCSHQTSAPVAFNRSTHVGGWSASGRALACPTGRGGAAADSYALSEEQLSIGVPVSLNASDHGVEVGWSIALTGSTNASFGKPVFGCPFNVTRYHFIYAHTNFTYTFAYQWCDVEAVVNVAGYAELLDLTTGGAIHPANSWSGVHLASGVQTISYGYFGAYSNRSYWSSNYSIWVSENYSFGASSRLVGTFSPSWFLNGSFNGSHRYMVVVELNVSVAAESFMYHLGRSAATFSAGGTTGHEKLRPPVIF